MALLVHIKRGGRLFVNGAVLENASGRTSSVLLRNEATIMRGEDILPPVDGHSPATRIYTALQGAYLFLERRETLLALAFDLLDAYEQAAASAAVLAGELRAAVDAGRLYAALKPARALIEHEHQTMRRICDDGSDGREPASATCGARLAASDAHMAPANGGAGR